MMFSIVTPVLNQARYLPATIASLEAQASAAMDIEHIVVDGGSTDGTLDILREYQRHEPYTIKILTGADQGMYDAINKGFMQARGDVFAWLNADDCYRPRALETVDAIFAENATTQWAYGLCDMIDDVGNATRQWITNYKNIFARRYNYACLLAENFICQPAVFFRRSAWEAIGPLTPHYRYAADYEYWLRLGALYTPVIIRQTLADFRWHAASLGGRGYAHQFDEELTIARSLSSQNRGAYLLHVVNRHKIVWTYSLMETWRAMRAAIFNEV